MCKVIFATAASCAVAAGTLLCSQATASPLVGVNLSHERAATVVEKAQYPYLYERRDYYAPYMAYGPPTHYSGPPTYFPPPAYYGPPAAPYYPRPQYGYAPPPAVHYPSAPYAVEPIRPRSCGKYRYWNGEYCADARYERPYVGPKW